MLCDLREDNRKKCECYWPTIIKTTKVFDDVEVYMDKEVRMIEKCLIRREFIIRICGVEKRVTQLHMINWPDHSIPEGETGFATLNLVLNSISEFKTIYPNLPILTHCR